MVDPKLSAVKSATELLLFWTTTMKSDNATPLRRVSRVETDYDYDYAESQRTNR